MYKIPMFVLQELREDLLLRYILQMHPELGDKEAFPWVCETPWKWDTFCDDSYGWTILFLIASTLQEYPYNGVFLSEEDLITHVASQSWVLIEERRDAFNELVSGIQYAMHRAEIHDIVGTIVYRYNNSMYPESDNCMWTDGSIEWNIRIPKTPRAKLLLLQIVTASKAWEKALKEVWLDNEKEWSKHLGVCVSGETSDTLADYIVNRMKEKSLYV